MVIDYKIKNKSHFAKLLKSKEKIFKQYEEMKSKQTKKASYVRKSNFPNVEEALIIWMKNIRSQNIKINLSSYEIRAKAKSLAQKMGYENFKASDGYISGLKKRHNISFITEHGESSSVNHEVIENWKLQLENELIGYKPKDVYNLDETALFYKLMPNKTFAFGNETNFGGKQYKDRITLSLITNADGSDRKAIMIGKYKNPRAFRNVGTLPIDYYLQTNAWVNSEIFRQILNKFNRKMKSENRKILLFVDNCLIHNQDFDFSNIKVKYFPPNATSVLQPLDQGIIHSFKANYRKELISLMINNFDNEIEFSPK